MVLAVATPRYSEPEGDGDVARPVLARTSGYVRRAADTLPRLGRERPWRVVQNYLYDLAVMRLGRIDEDHANARVEWLRMGSPEYLRRADVERLQEASVMTTLSAQLRRWHDRLAGRASAARRGRGHAGAGRRR